MEKTKNSLVLVKLKKSLALNMFSKDYDEELNEAEREAIDKVLFELEEEEILLRTECEDDL